MASITLLNSVTNISSSAFYQCTSLTNITIGSGLTRMGTFAFQGCSLLTSVTIGSPSIGANWFATSIGGGDSSVTRITLLDSVTNIAAYAFTGYSSLTNVAIGSGVTSIGNGAFLGCTALLAINVSPNNSSYSSAGGVLFDASQSTLIQYPEFRGGNSYTVPISVTNIGYEAFESAFHLGKIYFMGNAPNLGASAFDYTPWAIVYYLPGTTGWGATYGGQLAVLWNPQAQTGDGSFGVQTNQFGFNITGTTNISVVVEACTNLFNAVWQPVQTNTLTSGSVYFSDPQWTNYPGRFYRFSSP